MWHDEIYSRGWTGSGPWVGFLKGATYIFNKRMNCKTDVPIKIGMVNDVKNKMRKEFLQQKWVGR